MDEYAYSFVPFSPQQEVEIVNYLIEDEMSYHEIAKEMGVSVNRIISYVDNYLS